MLPEVLDGKAVMRLLGTTDPRVFYRAVESGMPGRFLGGRDVRRWRSERSALLKWLRGGTAKQPSPAE